MGIPLEIVSSFKILLIFRANSNIDSGMEDRPFLKNTALENTFREDLSRKPKLQELKYKLIK